MREDLAEQYLLGRLDEAEAEQYERHFFECDRCFRELETLRTLIEQLRRREASPTSRSSLSSPFGWPVWVRVAAGLIVAAGLALVVHLASGPDDGSSRLTERGPGRTEDTASVITEDAESGEFEQVVSGSIDRPKAADSPSLATPIAMLERLAAIEPPAYSPTVLRSSPDRASLLFREAMTRYLDRDWEAAADGLADAAALAPGRPDIAFFLGASRLLAGDSEGAVEQLERTLALGDSPFVEEARLCLAKAHLRAGRLEPARSELARLVALDGDLAAEAGELLAALEAIEASDEEGR